MGIPSLIHVIGACTQTSLIAKVLNDQNLFTGSNLVNWFSSYVQFRSGDRFSKRAEAAL